MLCIQVGSTHCQICSAVVGGGRGEVGKVPRSANAFQVPPPKFTERKFSLSEWTRQ